MPIYKLIVSITKIRQNAIAVCEENSNNSYYCKLNRGVFLKAIIRTNTDKKVIYISNVGQGSFVRTERNIAITPVMRNKYKRSFVLVVCDDIRRKSVDFVYI